MPSPVMDAHVRVGVSRDVTLNIETLLALMSGTGIDLLLIAPAEPQIAFYISEGNAAVLAMGARVRE